MSSLSKWCAKLDRASATWDVIAIPGLYLHKEKEGWRVDYHRYHPVPQAVWVTRKLKGQVFQSRKEALCTALLLGEVYQEEQQAIDMDRRAWVEEHRALRILSS